MKINRRNYVRIGALATITSTILFAGCATINGIRNSAPPPTTPKILNIAGVTTWQNDNHKYFNGQLLDLTVKTGALDALNFFAGTSKLRRYDRAVPPGASGYANEQETLSKDNRTRTDQYSVRLSNLVNHENCSITPFSLKTASINPKYKGVIKQTTLSLVFINKGPKIDKFDVPQDIKQGQSFNIRFTAQAKKAELLEQLPGKQPIPIKTIVSTGCDQTLSAVVTRKAVSRSVTYILKVWNEIGIEYHMKKIRGTLPTTGSETVFLQHTGAVAGVFSGQAYEPQHPGNCKAIITDVKTPYVNYTPAGGTSICDASTQNLAVAHTDANGVYKNIDSIGCSIDTNVFNGQTVIGTWNTNFSVNGGFPPTQLTLDVYWKLPPNCN